MSSALGRWLSALWWLVSVRLARWFRFASALRPVRVSLRPAPPPRLRLSAPAFASPYCVRPHAPYVDCLWRSAPPAVLLALLRFSLSAGLNLLCHRLPSLPLRFCSAWWLGFSGFPNRSGFRGVRPVWLPPVNIIPNRYIPVKHFLHYMEGIFFSTSAKHFKAFIFKGSQGLKAVIFSGIEQEAESVKHYPVRKCPILCDFAQICPCFSF